MNSLSTTTRIAPEPTDQRSTGTTRNEPPLTRLTPTPKSLSAQIGHLSTQDIYPHVYDPQSTESAAFVLRDLQAAGNDLSIAIEEFSQGNLTSVATQLSLVAVRMASAHKQTSFNEALGGVVSHIRRVALSLDASEASIEQLMLVSRVLAELQATPMLTLGEAADLVVAMEDLGLTGEIPGLDELISSLLGDAEESPQQTLEFNGQGN